ncbi:glycoside hydrolase domain-containing protein [Candidatus Enterococcus ikei]|uniref:DUF1906 domain-containing protein n=1 Tax=Candidatus Enterococcus ikei TaxID=2815326 RepID=A0ABS3GVN8_9ENTE|nr:glycoside hydrolase domain-containing protein [Enterococcus sp. DIV0869a]MBO0438890.1 DUF1906 domain-containing protein [Enterococcus sp. DIV0869a]
METRGITDPWVKKVQKWLNETYQGKSGWGSVPEDGKTGWPTIYGLIRAVQVELGITSLADNFGPTTQAKWDQKVPGLLVEGTKHNIIKLIDGALICKGLGTLKFSETYDLSTDYGIKQFKSLAGFHEPTGALAAMWAKALFDMSAFKKVFGGSEKVREVQQYLNRLYHPYTGILPCDGIYQRDTNKALIYGLQAEMGMDTEHANGYFGEGTTALCPTLSSTQGTIRNITLLQAALIVNEEYDGEINGIWSPAITTAVNKYKSFMRINPINGVADMPVIKALLSTTGDTNRSAEGFDASTRLTQEMVNTVKSYGMHYAGRYLTGTAGSGINRKPKNLTVPEARLLLNNGINIVPIYQDNNAELSDYSYSIGQSDGNAGFDRAFKLGIPADTIIYFAVDVDTTLDQIEEYIIPYFEGINEALKNFGAKWDYFYTYRVGVYGPRNVCKILSDKGLASSNCYVSNMSSGFSANLGYPQPREWAFDQFSEPLYGVGSGLGHIYIDKVAVSGKNSGVSYIQPEMNQMKEVLKEFNLPSLTNLLNSGSVVFGKEITVADLGVAKVTFKPTIGLSPKQGDQVFNITNGKIDAKFTQEIIKNFDASYTQNLNDGAESISAKIKNGDVSVSVGATSSGKISYAITVNVIDHEFEQGAGKVSFSFTFKIEIKKFFFDDNHLKEVNWEFITTLSVLAMAVIALALIFSGAMAGIGTLIALFSMLLVS